MTQYEAAYPDGSDLRDVARVVRSALPVAPTGIMFREPDNVVLVDVAGTLTGPQQNALTAAVAATTPEANAPWRVRDTITNRATTALVANDAFLAIGSPTNAQVLAQVRLLTRECSGIIRLMLDQLETADGT